MHETRIRTETIRLPRAIPLCHQAAKTERVINTFGFGKKDNTMGGWVLCVSWNVQSEDKLYQFLHWLSRRYPNVYRLLFSWLTWSRPQWHKVDYRLNCIKSTHNRTYTVNIIRPRHTCPWLHLSGKWCHNPFTVDHLYLNGLPASKAIKAKVPKRWVCS